MKVIIVTGQTATGKTNLALKLAQKNNGELVNFDSRHVYRKLNIVTGKYETAKKMFAQKNNVPIWLFDIIDPNEYFSSYDYQKCAHPILADILKRGKTPVLVGGTYFYLKHLLYGVQTENIPADLTLRQKLNKNSVVELQKLLKKINSELFNSLNNSDRNNPQRLIRKIEIANAKDRKTENQSNTPLFQQKTITFQCIGLKFGNKERLIEVIQNRVTKRINMGAIEEVKLLLKENYSNTDPGMKTIGYPQLIDHLEGKLSLSEAQKIWAAKEVQYAKRQLTFMQRDDHILWDEIA